MSDNHQHPAPDTVTPAPVERRATDAAVIVQLNARLNQKANDLRTLEDREVYLTALANDLQGEIVGLHAMVDQVVAENKILRNRLGLPEVGAIEPIPEDNLVLDAHVEEAPHD